MCGDDYWCFNTLSSYCGNTTACGTQGFIDPVPAGNIITNISIDFYSAGCGNGTMTGDVNGSVFPVVNDANTGCPCSSSPCAVAATSGQTFPCGIPNYNYGAANNFQLCTGLDVCVNQVILTMTYVPANQASPAFQPSPIVGATPVCIGVAQNYSIPAVANANSYTWTFPPGWTINSGQGTSSASATPGSSGNICVTATNLCGTSAPTCFPVTVTPLPIGTFSYPGTPYCQNAANPSPTYSGGGVAGTFTSAPAGLSINAGNGTVNLAASTPGTYTVTNTINSAGCPMVIENTTITITAMPIGTFSYPGTPYCQNAANPSPTYSGGGVAGTYTSAPGGLIINAGTGVVNLAASTPGTYTVTNTIPAAGGCPAVIENTTITVTVLPVGTFSYPGTPYCQNAANPSPTYSGGGVAGTYTFVPAGLSINTGTGAVNLVASTPGTYTVTNTIPAGNGCPAVIENTTITITALPVGTFSYPGTPYCQNAANPSPTYSGGGVAGTYTFVPAGLSINTGTGTVSLVASSPGTYTVTNTIPAGNGCPAVIENTTITINAVDDSSFTYPSGTYCLTGTDPIAAITGTSGGIFTITAPGVINSGDGTVDLSASGLGSYTVTYTTPTANPCPTSTTFLITITSAPTAGFSYDLAQYCQDSLSPTLIMNAGSVAGVFSANSGGLIVDASGNITLPSSVPGIYTLYNNVAAAGGCAAAIDSTTIEILQVDSALFSYSNSSYCISATDPIANLAGTVGGVYTISSPGVINPGNGTINLVASGLGTFTIYYNTSPAGNSCPALDSLQVTVDSANTITSNPISPLCASDPLSLAATSSGTGTITWYSDAGGITVIGTGSPLSLPNPGIGTYTYYVNNVGVCSSSMDSVIVVIGGVTAVINATPVTGAIPLSVFFGNGSTTGAGVSYNWDLGDGNTSNQFEPTNVYGGAGTYNVILIVTDGICSDTTSIIIDAFGESAILIPNVFTPNGDGSNDVFTIDGINLESVEGEIFNRWGQKMFSWNNIKGHWDGRTLSGTKAPDGTYFYIIKAKGFDGTEYF
ncbi:MAG: gliding motility-associated C-terminal domain-containing protein, partial [Cycloclasticus sp.]|nr:gliding motility-associated C-terminal domain-containing protein [Cycloclasticus sp.]